MAKAPYKTPYGDAPSVTTVLGVIDKPFIPNWIKKEARLAIIEMLKAESKHRVAYDVDCGYDFSWDIDTIENKLKYAMDAHKRKAENAMEFGTFIHNSVEAFFKENPMPKAEYIEFLAENAPGKMVMKNLNYNIPDAVRATMTAFFEAIQKHGINILESEKTVYFKSTIGVHAQGEGKYAETPMLYAGTLDMIADVLVGPSTDIWSPRSTPFARHIGDLKTGSRISDDYWKQVAAYMVAEEQLNGKHHEGAFILRLDTEKYGKYEFKRKERKELLDRYWPQFVGAYLNFSGMKKPHNAGQ